MKVLSLIHLFQSPARYEEKLIRSIYIAIVGPLSQEARVDIEFYQTACLNQGWKVVIFTKRENAVAWLKWQAGEKP